MAAMTSQQTERHMMASKTLAGQGAIASRSRVVATTFMCALSATVRFTTATGNEAKILGQSVHRSNPMTFIATRDGSPVFLQGSGAEIRPSHRLSKPEILPRAMCATHSDTDTTRRLSRAMAGSESRIGQSTSLFGKDAGPAYHIQLKVLTARGSPCPRFQTPRPPPLSTP